MNQNIKKYFAFFAIALMGGAVGAGTINWIGTKNTSNNGIASNPVRLAALGSSNDGLEHPDFVAASAMTTPAVVHIKVKMGAPDNDEATPESPFDFFDPRMLPRGGGEATGSGVIISKDGYIITNNHVIENSSAIEVVLNDKRSFKAELIGRDPSTDLALIKITAKDELPTLVYGNSDAVKVGEWVLAVGNPFNLTSTVTAGIISAKARNINILGGGASVESFLQTDAAVNPGNSGGALVNTQGQLIGINSAIASETGSFTGYSFAIPANLAKKVIADLMEFGKVQRGFLGIQIRDVDGKLVEEKNLSVNEGVYIEDFSDNSSAKGSGIERGDVIVAVDGVGVGSSPELQEQIGRHRPGDKVALTINRKGTKKDYTVTLRDNKGGTTASNSTEKGEFIEKLGAELASITKEEREKLKIVGGVKILSIKNKKLRILGITEGFVITKVAKQDVRTPEDVAEILSNKRDAVLIEGYNTNGERAFYGFGID
jgi:Do/DeqQ family serine protease